MQKQRAEELGLVVGLKNDQLRQVLADPLKGFELVLLMVVVLVLVVVLLVMVVVVLFMVVVVLVMVAVVLVMFVVVFDFRDY